MKIEMELFGKIIKVEQDRRIMGGENYMHYMHVCKSHN